MDSPQVTYLEPFHPIDWDPGTHLVLHVFDSYRACLRRVRPYFVYLIQFLEDNPELIPEPLSQRLTALFNQFQDSVKANISAKRNAITRRGHRVARQYFKQLRQIRIEFDELTIKRVVEVVKQRHIASERPEAGPTPAEPEGEVVILEDPSRWDETRDARILKMKRDSPDQVQAALVWTRDALAIFGALIPVEQAESLIELYAEWKKIKSDPKRWVKMHLIPSQRKLVGDLRDRVMELKWTIAGKQDQIGQIDEDEGAEFTQRRQEAAEEISEAIRRQESPPGWQFREPESDADESEAFQDSPPKSPTETPKDHFPSN